MRRSMFYDEIMAARNWKIWSMFSGLVNTANSLCEQLEEQRRLVAEESDESSSLPSLVEDSTTDESETAKIEDPNLKSEVVSSEQVERERPGWLVQMMENMNGELTDAKLIIEKCLFVTDVNPTQNRLSMPYKGLLHKNFLTDVELEIIEQDIGEKKKIGVEVILVNQNCVEWKVKLKRWEMNGSWNYILVGCWNAFVKSNALKAGDNIRVWSFRCSGVRYFALEKTN